MASKKSPTKKTPQVPPHVHSAPTAAMLSFANPPLSDNAAAAANVCAKQGFATVGVVIANPTDVIDFSRFDPQSCTDLANSIEICVDGKGFEVPSLAGTFDVLREHGTQITFANFVKGLTSIMKPKA